MIKWPAVCAHLSQSFLARWINKWPAESVKRVLQSGYFNGTIGDRFCWKSANVGWAKPPVCVAPATNTLTAGLSRPHASRTNWFSGSNRIEVMAAEWWCKAKTIKRPAVRFNARRNTAGRLESLRAAIFSASPRNPPPPPATWLIAKPNNGPEQRIVKIFPSSQVLASRCGASSRQVEAESTRVRIA